MISIGKKLFEVDIPKQSEIVNENIEKGIVEMESSWTGQIKGLNLFPSGRVEGNGNSILTVTAFQFQTGKEHSLQKKEKKYHLSGRTQINTANTLY